jgi:hypothetical protein
MKRISIVLTMLAITTATRTLADDETCAMIGKMAETVMTDRQNGTPIGEMIAWAKTFPTDAHRDLARSFVLEAYDIPAYGIEPIKKTTIREFTDDIQLKCYKSMDKATK